MNSAYQIFCSSPRSHHAIKIFALQVFSDRWRAFLEAYEKVLNSEIKYQALLCDMHPLTNHKYRIRTGIFKEGTPLTVFIPKK